jgi:hypothetical protein
MNASSLPTAASTQLQVLQDALARLGQGEVTAHAFSAASREHLALLAALPARYTEVLLNLLDRLESGALFSEESCSFSQKDLIASLQMWADKARGVLAAAAAAATAPDQQQHD